jgi:predicted CxxxxCH...CXXCH cytochrome family protein
MRGIVLAMVLSGCVGEIDMGAPGSSEPPPNADPQAGCALGCHGTDSSNAPPMGLAGVTDTTSVGVGAHAQHMTVAPTWHRQLACGDCHVVPADVSSPGHIDGDNKAEVTFSMEAGPNSTWSGTTCTTGCHGNTTLGGSSPTPQWTKVDGTQATCGSCHSTPPPAPHPVDTNCGSCHPTIQPGSLTTFLDPSSHINGVVEVTGSGAAGECSSCHGSGNNSAPPRDLSGNTAATAQGVGAHTAHLATSTWHRQVTCSNCHAVPTDVNSPGHLDGDNISEVRFDTLNPAAVYTRGTATCSNQYCHGNGRGNTGTKVWTQPGALACGACHSVTGVGMSGDHNRHINGENMKCSECHADVVDANLAIKNATLHVNGVHEVKMAKGTFNAATRQCTNTACHGTETW